MNSNLAPAHAEPPPSLEDGSRVRHVQKGVIGHVTGVSRMPKYFEYPDDTFVYRLQVSPRRIIPCSPRNAELLSPLPKPVLGLELSEAARTVVLGALHTAGGFAVTHCYSCKAPVPKVPLTRCADCCGNFCGCGACLCGYSGSRRF